MKPCWDYRNSGKNDGNYACARRAAEKYDRIIKILEYSVVMNQEEQDERDELLLKMLKVIYSSVTEL